MSLVSPGPASYLALALGGLAGTFLRYWLVLGLLRFAGPDIPWGVLLANWLGSFAMAFSVAFLASVFEAQPAWRLFLLVGFCGSFTTFSTFSMDLLIFFGRGQVGLGLLYCLATVAGGLLLAWGGWGLGHLLKATG
jgi:CrcB protein